MAKKPAENAAADDKVEVKVNGQYVTLAPDLDAAIRRAVAASKRPLPPEMTPNQAADYLDVSRPFIVKLIRRGELPCRMVGKHRRIPSEALKVYKKSMASRAHDAADEMVRIAQEEGWYDEYFKPNV